MAWNDIVALITWISTILSTIKTLVDLWDRFRVQKGKNRQSKLKNDSGNRINEKPEIKLTRKELLPIFTSWGFTFICFAFFSFLCSIQVQPLGTNGLIWAIPTALVMSLVCTENNEGGDSYFDVLGGYFIISGFIIAIICAVSSPVSGVWVIGFAGIIVSIRSMYSISIPLTQLLKLTRFIRIIILNLASLGGLISIYLIRLILIKSP